MRLKEFIRKLEKMGNIVKKIGTVTIFYILYAGPTREEVGIKIKT